MNKRLFTFVGGKTGTWTVRSQSSIIGEPLAEANKLEILSGSHSPKNSAWSLRGITSNERYVEHAEKLQLVAKQEGLGRPEATFAALIPIRKTQEWWSLTQDDRRKIFEEQSKHIALGLRYLPHIARRLHHCRDLSETEPFDFLTWFEYIPNDEPMFESLLDQLRASLEWKYVDREIDIRLVRSTS